MIDYSKTPFLVIWETTQACDLACAHCRAEAQTEPHPGELTFDEAKGLLKQVHEMGTPIFVFTGGDPLKRKDLVPLVRYGKELGLRTATIPATSPRLTFDRLKELKEAGLDQIAFSLDFPRAEQHDTFRGVPGAYDKALEGLQWAQSLGIPTQINTTITKESLPYLREMGELVERLGIVFWEVFFLVPVGRGNQLAWLTAQECEQAFEILYRVHKDNTFILKVTEAPHYRRFVAEQETTSNQLPPRLRKSEGPGGSVGRAPQAVNSGKGFLFVSYEGIVYPSGFLPTAAGSIRNDSLANIYQNSTLFKQLRDPSVLKGPCGVCSYREMCGGSRSRSYALTQDAFASDPWCIKVASVGSSPDILTQVNASTG